MINKIEKFNTFCYMDIDNITKSEFETNFIDI